jgi:hypothetical protein
VKDLTITEITLLAEALDELFVTKVRQILDEQVSATEKRGAIKQLEEDLSTIEKNLFKE